VLDFVDEVVLDPAGDRMLAEVRRHLANGPLDPDVGDRTLRDEATEGRPS
jgi:hypothetical protein